MRSIWIDSGSVSARFVPSANARFLLFGPGPATAFVSGDSLITSEQTASGAMVSLNDIFLQNYDPSVAHGITRATRDINGDANFALGRWAAGMVSALFWIDLTVRGSDYNNYHYLAFNRLMSWPTSGAPSCDSGVFTSPTYINGGPTGKPARGTVTASVTLSFDTYGAFVNGPINVTAGSETGTLNLSARPQSALTTPFVYSDSKTFLSVALGDAGNNATLIAIGYETTLPSGSRYRGVARFRCI